MKKLKSLSVFFPVYNEEENIPLFVNEALEILPRVAQKYEIIIINDGSKDRSKKIAQTLAKENKNIRLVNHRDNRGYGAALKSGFKASKYDWVFFTDGDLQFNLHQIKKFIPHTENHDLMIGFRKKRAEGKIRAFNARLFKVYIDLLFRLHVKDIDCAFKLIKANQIKSLNLISDGAFTSAEFLYKLKKKKVKLKQIAVTHQARKFGKPTGNDFKVIVKAGWEALRLYSQIKFGLFKS